MTTPVDSGTAIDISVRNVELLVSQLRVGFDVADDASDVMYALRSALTEAQQEIIGLSMPQPAVIGTVTHYSSEQLLAERDEARAALTARAEQIESELGVLYYMVNNPSAWEDGFNQAASDTIERAVSSIRAILANGETK